MNNDYQHKSDCQILRGAEAKQYLPDRPCKALLIDSDGDLVFQFPEAWTDEQIWHALLFVNAKFVVGIDIGRSRAQREFRKALGID